ncbi:MAG TPA: sigma 54-interacting transcriptional regulator [Polyangia bacterium]|nr:sigma 54-interacting transcriptional regulator [Polyangia bacterium]
MSRRMLLIDVDAARAARVARLGRALGWTVELARGAAAAIPRLGAAPFDLCLIHLELPAPDATAVALKARTCCPPVPTAAIDAAGRGAVDVLRAGAAEIVPLPRSRDELAAVASRLLDGQGRTRGRASGAPLVVGDDPALGHALAQLDALAGCDAPVLIRGETGTGKATMARLLHAAGPRRDGRFVAINLAAVPPERAEAQLARHGVRRGWLAAARGGTLFLDEIDVLSRGAQAALVWRLRAARPLVRLVGATRHPVDGLVERGVLDPALGEMFGAGQAVIELPPLRARRSDIPTLAEHFRRQVNAREGRRVPGFALDVMRRFSQHDWPGNVRELQNLVEQLVITAGTRMVVMNDLPSRLRIQVLDFERAARGLSPDGIDPRELLAELEAQFIAEALGAPSRDSSPHVSQKSRRRYVA